MVTPELLYQYSFFRFLNKTQLKAVARITKEEVFKSGEVIFREGAHADWLYILAKGSVDLYFTVEVPYRPELNKELLFGTVGPGAIFGVSALVEPHQLTSSARASKASQVIMIEAAGLLALCNKDEKLAYGFIHQVAVAMMERINATRLQLATARLTVPS
jgi:CRP-like cAMP-binding protein